MTNNSHERRKRLAGCLRFAAVVGLAGAGLLVFVLLRISQLPAGVERGKLEAGGVERDYIYYVPPGYDPSVSTALVISIHGFASWPKNQMDISQWNELAEEEGFIVVYPAGLGRIRRWRSGGASDAQGELEEVAFISALIDRFEQDYAIDPNRIYANGLSNGAGMTYLLACRLSDRIAAAAGVAGAYQLDPEQCSPSRPMPLILFHGTEDPIVPYLGGRPGSYPYELPSIPEWASAWAGRNGCNPQPVPMAAVGAVSAVRYTGCIEQAEVIFYTVEGGGHTWPGGGYLPAVITGPTNHEVDATRLIWEFYETPRAAR